MRLSFSHNRRPLQAVGQFNFSVKIDHSLFTLGVLQVHDVRRNACFARVAVSKTTLTHVTKCFLPIATGENSFIP